MGLDAVRASLERAVAALFTGTEKLSSDTEDIVLCTCCGGLQMVPAAWRTLRDFPVCARFVVAEWRRLAPTGTPGKRKSTTARELHVESMARLCSVFHACGLLASRGSDDRELVATLVDAMDADGSTDRTVLCRVLQSRVLARCVRFRLFQWALSTDERADDGWIRQAAEALQEELRQASIERVSHESSTKSRKRSRAAMGTLAKGDEAIVCTSCAARRGQESSQETARASLVAALTAWLRGRTAGVAIAEAIEALIDVLNAPDVVHLLERREGPIPRPKRNARSRSQPSHKIRWEECDHVVEKLCVEAQTPMWRLVWKRERCRTSGASPTGTLDKLVLVCAKVDQFAPSISKSVDVPIGFRVAYVVISQLIKRPYPIATILQAIAAAAEQHAFSVTTAATKASLRTTRNQLIEYVRYLINHDGIEDIQRVAHTPSTPSRRASTPPAAAPNRRTQNGATANDLLESVELIHTIVAGNVSAREEEVDSERCVLSALWFQLVFKEVCEGNGSTETTWSLFLDTIAQCCEDLSTLISRCKPSFEDLVAELVVGIVVSGGAHIKAPDGCHVVGSIAIPIEETSQGMLQALLSLVINAFKTPRVVVASVTRLLMIITRRNDAHIQRLSVGSGIPRLLLPLLDAFVSGSKDTREATMSTVVALVQAQIQRHRDSPKLTRAFVNLLHEWDCFSKRQTQTIAGTTSTQADSLEGEGLGLLAARKQGLWQDLVCFYASDTTDLIARETRAFRRAVLHLLQTIDSDACPPELEGSLFSVAARISSTLEETQSHRDPEHVHHSNDTIFRFIRAFESSTNAGECHRLVETLKRNGKLEDLALNLKRWLGVVVVSPESMPTETRAKLVVLANRLVYWCTIELQAVKVMLVPVDGALLTGLQLFSTAQATPQVSVVRLSVMVRAYLSVSTVSDLGALTGALLDAVLVSTATPTRDGLLKLMHAFSAFMIAEVVVDKLHAALLLVGDRGQARIVRNALSVLTSAQSTFGTEIIAFSSDVFSVPIAERWLAAILHAIIPFESAASTSGKAVEAFLACLESLFKDHNQDEDGDPTHKLAVFRQAIAVDALLSTVEMATPQYDNDSPILKRFRSIRCQLQPHLEEMDENGSALNAHEIDRDHCLLMVIPQKQQQGESEYASGLVHVIRGDITKISVEGRRGEWARPVDKISTDAINAEANSTTVRFYLTFSSWLKSALMVQQQSPVASMSEDSTTVWETVFSDVVLQFYLPVQFHGDANRLTTEWLSTWVDQSVALGRTIDLQPFQRAIMLQLLLTSDPWKHLTHTARLLLADSVPHALCRAIMDHVAAVLDTVVLISSRLLSSDTVNAMTDDISALLEQLFHPSDPIDEVVHRLATVAPVVEAFVRASLQVSRDPGESSVLDGVRRVGVCVHQLVMQSEVSVLWWRERLSMWTRRFSHLNRREASLVFGALDPNSPAPSETT